MKNLRFISFWLLLTVGLATVVFNSCKDENEDKKETPHAIQVKNEQDLTQTLFADKKECNDIRITTTGAWTSTIKPAAVSLGASGAMDWISISPDYGDKAGDYTISITLETNDTGKDRTAQIVLSSGDTEIVIAITQKAQTKGSGDDSGNTNTIVGTWRFVRGSVTLDGQTTGTTVPKRWAGISFYEDGRLLTASFNSGTYTTNGSAFSTTITAMSGIAETFETGQTVNLMGVSTYINSYTYNVKNDTLRITLDSKQTAMGMTTTSVSTDIYARTVTSISLDKDFVELSFGIGEPEEYTLTATTVSANAVDKVTWISSNPAIATVTDGKIKALAVGETTITAKAYEKTATCRVVVWTVSDNINGETVNEAARLLWATRNVDKPNTFAAKPTDAGMLYQYGINVGWSSTDPLINSNGGTQWDGSTLRNTIWEASANPCPAGWRVPTGDDFDDLMWIATRAEGKTVNGVRGIVFGDGPYRLFLPETNHRYSDNGELRDYHWNYNSKGFYWSSTRKDTYYSTAYMLGHNQLALANESNSNGYCVRCVRDK
jgi:uncharacterized protein (TIGR02145 family)